MEHWQPPEPETIREKKPSSLTEIGQGRVARAAVVARELDRLEAMHRRVAEITALQDRARRAELLSIRQELSAQILTVGRAAGQFLETGSDTETVRLYRLKYATMRTSATLHRANWPAVLLGEHGTEYRASAALVHAANVDFLNWMRGVLMDVR